MNPRSSTESSVQPLRDRFRLETSRLILDAAEEALVERGLHEAAMGEIAARAGVAVGTLYNHFVDRDTLVAALVADRRSQLLGRIDEALRAQARGAFRDQLGALAAAFAAHIDAHRRFIQILLDASV